jgi:hypothetical protein
VKLNSEKRKEETTDLADPEIIREFTENENKVLKGVIYNPNHLGVGTGAALIVLPEAMTASK